MAGRHKSLGRDHGLAKAVKGVLQGPAGIADELRRRDVLGVQRALADSEAEATATTTTVSDLVERVARIEELLAQLGDPTQIPAVWVHLQTDGAGGVTIVSGYGLASAVVAGAVVNVTFERAFTSGEWSSAGHRQTNAAGGVYVGAESATGATVGVWTTTGGVNLGTAIQDFGVMIWGELA